jgi:hypothetical protein
MAPSSNPTITRTSRQENVKLHAGRQADAVGSALMLGTVNPVGLKAHLLLGWWRFLRVGLEVVSQMLYRKNLSWTIPRR